MSESIDELVGVPDAFQRLWTPHRMVYIDGAHKPADDSASQCPFCRAPSQSDEQSLIVHRGRTCFVVLNLYPYSPGHLLVCPYRHISDLTDMTVDEGAELTLLTQQAMLTLRGTAKPHGFNVGVNQGDVAGAGIAAHLHQHVVPRWKGDSNFMPIVAQTRALPQLLGDARELIHGGWVGQVPGAGGV